MRDFAVPVGRLLLALIFIMSGINKIMGWPGVVGAVEAKGLPIPMLFGAGAILLELGGGLLVAIGYKARIGAAALILFTIMTMIFKYIELQKKVDVASALSVVAFLIVIVIVAIYVKAVKPMKEV